MAITFWDDQISNIEENKWYHFSNVVIKNYFGTKLSVMRRSRIISLDIDDNKPQLLEVDLEPYHVHTEEIAQRIQNKICCADITTVVADILSGFIRCKRRLVIVPDSKMYMLAL